MTGFEIIILLLVIIVSAAAVGFYLTKGQPNLEEMVEQDEQSQLTQELCNKDLHPIVTKKTPTGSLTESAQELIKEVNRVSKVPATQEESQQLVKDLVELATTSPKKKKKYYPKKKKA